MGQKLTQREHKVIRFSSITFYRNLTELVIKMHRVNANEYGITILWVVNYQSKVCTLLKQELFYKLFH